MELMMGAEVPTETQFEPGPWAQQIEEWYPDLLDPDTAHAANYAGHPDVQNDILSQKRPDSQPPTRLVIACGAAAIAEAA